MNSPKQHSKARRVPPLSSNHSKSKQVPSQVEQQQRGNVLQITGPDSQEQRAQRQPRVSKDQNQWIRPRKRQKRQQCICQFVQHRRKAAKAGNQNQQSLLVKRPRNQQQYPQLQDDSDPDQILQRQDFPSKRRRGKVPRFDTLAQVDQQDAPENPFSSHSSDSVDEQENSPNEASSEENEEDLSDQLKSSSNNHENQIKFNKSSKNAESSSKYENSEDPVAFSLDVHAENDEEIGQVVDPQSILERQRRTSLEYWYYNWRFGGQGHCIYPAFEPQWMDMRRKKLLKKYVADNIENISRIRETLNLDNQLNFGSNFVNLSNTLQTQLNNLQMQRNHDTMRIRSVCWCNRCPYFRCVIDFKPLWWVQTMGCQYTKQFFRLFDIHPSYTPIYDSHYNQVKIPILKSENVEIASQMFKCGDDFKHSFDQIMDDQALSIKEKKSRLKQLEKGYMDEITKCFPMLVPKSISQRDILEKFQFYFNGRVFQFSFPMQERLVYSPNDWFLDRDPLWPQRVPIQPDPQQQ